MGDGTGISWTDATWNPVRGCSRISEGCRHCYAERVAARFSDEGQPYHGLAVRKLKVISDDEQRTEARWTGEVRLVPEHLADPLRWHKPRRIFVNSMSDLFHERLTNEQIAAVFGVMAASPQHTFQALTKRARRMREWFAWYQPGAVDRIANALDDALIANGADFRSRSAINRASRDATWPLPNVWLGVSVENQNAADDRVSDLLTTPAAVRFISAEPLLGPTSLWAFIDGELRNKSLSALGSGPLPGLDWVIAGCESGPGARPCDVTWLRSIRDQCAAARVAFFLKQAEESTDLGADGLLDVGDDDSIAFGDGSKLKARGGGGNRIVELPYLDGVQHAAFPVVRS